MRLFVTFYCNLVDLPPNGLEQSHPVAFKREVAAQRCQISFNKGLQTVAKGLPLLWLETRAMDAKP